MTSLNFCWKRPRIPLPQDSVVSGRSALVCATSISMSAAPLKVTGGPTTASPMSSRQPTPKASQSTIVATKPEDISSPHELTAFVRHPTARKFSVVLTACTTGRNAVRTAGNQVR